MMVTARDTGTVLLISPLTPRRGDTAPDPRQGALQEPFP